MPTGQARGIQFPADTQGKRSSVPPSKRMIAAALQGLDPAAARAVLDEPDWRHRYPRHWRAMVAAQASAPLQVDRSCQAGIDAAWAQLPFIADGGPVALADAMHGADAAGFTSVELNGTGDPAPAPWQVPLGGRWLAGDALARQIDRWERQGIAEPSHAQALRSALAHPEWFDLSDRTVVLLGAGSEAGPLAWLARWRARIVAVDLPHASTWRRIAERVRSGNATLIAPSREAGEIEQCGADLITDAPEIAAWLGGLGRALDIASLAYADGERHLRVSLAMDAIVATLCSADPRTTLAFMETPTDVFAVPEALAVAVMRKYDARGRVTRAAQAAARLGSGGRIFVPHIESTIDAGDAGRWGLVDGLVVQQGPNYALAKRLQQWRALVARAAGHRVSVNVAPSTTTASVVSNRLLAAGFRGAKTFDCEVFEPATTNALAAAMWVHDLRNSGTKADPATPLQHPLQLLCDGANHGGLWRVPCLPRSVLPLAALLGLLSGGRISAPPLSEGKTYTGDPG